MNEHPLSPGNLSIFNLTKDGHYRREEINKNFYRNVSNILESQAKTGARDDDVFRNIMT